MTEVTTNPDAALYKLTREPALPMKCVGCGRPADGKLEFVDFNVSFDYEGAILICRPCGLDIGRLVGLVDSNKIEEAAQEASLTAQSLEEAQQNVIRLTDQLTAYRSVLDSISNLDRVNALFEIIEGFRDKPVDEFDSTEGRDDQRFA